MGTETKIIEAAEQIMETRSWKDQPVTNRTGSWMTGSLGALLFSLAMAGYNQIQDNTNTAEANSLAIKHNATAIMKQVEQHAAHGEGHDHQNARHDHTKVAVIEKDIEAIRSTQQLILKAVERLSDLQENDRKEIEADYNRRMDKLEKLLQDNLKRN